MSEKCKFCGSDKPYLCYRWPVGDNYPSDPGRWPECYERELKQLRAENERLTERVEELEAACAGGVLVLHERNAELAEMTADYDRFQWLLKQGVAWRGCYRGGWMEGEWLYSEHNSRQEIDEFRNLTLTEPDKP